MKGGRMTKTEEVEAALAHYLTGQFEQFRVKLEAEMNQPIGALETNAALLLSDLCYFLGLAEEQHAAVLGAAGLDHIMHCLDAKVNVTLCSLSIVPRVPMLLEP
jgi:hypothetical protein